MGIICSALHTSFTPAVGPFNVQVSGEARLMRMNASGAGFVIVDEIRGRALRCDNEISGTVYRFEPIPGAESGSPVVEAAQ